MYIYKVLECSPTLVTLRGSWIPTIYVVVSFVSKKDIYTIFRECKSTLSSHVRHMQGLKEPSRIQCLPKVPDPSPTPGRFLTWIWCYLPSCVCWASLLWSFCSFSSRPESTMCAAWHVFADTFRRSDFTNIYICLNRHSVGHRWIRN